MEDHGGHPLLHGGQQLQSPAGAATLAYAWDYTPGGAPFDDHDAAAAGGGQLDSCASSTASDLRRALVRALAELDASRAAHQAELRRMESEAARLAALVASAAAERDELRRHCHSLLLLLHHQAQAATAAPPAPTPSLHAGVLGGSGGAAATAAAAAMDEHAPDAAACADDTELEMALARRLPEKGRLVEAVVSAGPLLQTLLLAGPLPRWRHPPPAAPADIPPFNPGRQSPLKTDGSNSSSASAGSSSPESNCSGGPPPAPAHALPSFHMSPFCM
ncbi:hypothetical protein SEVIR_7G000800v4 [Setaria viridis]|uniref:Uncharacterized protein n=1 Tax=Setaria viridis TaxID=4556 RepID=A0A4U6TKN4_SETVI|nr:hypothetical protein SEVIR_7G000800v2 [Setaria viridis]